MSADAITIKVGDLVATKRHGSGYVRGISHTTPELASVDLELVDNGEVLGWICLPLTDIVLDPAVEQ